MLCVDVLFSFWDYPSAEETCIINEKLDAKGSVIMEPKEEKQSFALDIYTIIQDFVWILTLISLLFVFLIRVVGVDGSSMYPTLMDHDYLLLQSNFTAPQYRQGDVVVLTKKSFSATTPIVKRVIATEGQIINIDFQIGTVTVDGEVLDEPYISEPTYLQYSDGMLFPIQVPEGCIFVMGDNRNHSADSRYAEIGMVDTRCVMGKVLFLAFPGPVTNEHGEVIAQRDFGRIGAVR